MQTYSNVNDPLDRELDFSHMKIEKAPYKFSTEEKILMTIKAYLAEGEIVNKEKFRQEADALLV